MLLAVKLQHFSRHFITCTNFTGIFRDGNLGFRKQKLGHPAVLQHSQENLAWQIGLSPALQILLSHQVRVLLQQEIIYPLSIQNKQRKQTPRKLIKLLF